MIYHIILAVPLMIASAKIDLAGNVFSITNINFLFIFLMSGLIFCSTLILWDKVVLYEKMTKTDKKLFPKSLLTWLFICYGLLCFWLFLIVFNKGDNLTHIAAFTPYLSVNQNFAFLLGQF